MSIVAFWFLCALVVGVAANSRGRSSVGWFLVAVLLSPLIGLLLVLVLPNLKGTAGPSQIERSPYPPPLPKARFLGRADRVTVNRSPRPFEPDGVYAGVPYRVADDGSIDAIMQGSMVRFRDLERFTRAIGGGT